MTTNTSGRTGDWDARTYHRISEPHVAWGRAVLDRVPLAGHERVLDVGCGTGRITRLIAERLTSGRVVGVDRSPQMLAEAAQGLRDLGPSRVGLVRAQATDLPFAEQVDVVFSTATFHWIHDHDALFRSVARALRPGGWLVAQCGGGPNLARIHGRGDDMMSDDRFAPFFRDWVEPWNLATAADTISRLDRAGFIDLEVTVDPSPVTLATPDGFAEFIATVVCREHLLKMPDPTTQRQFIEALTAAAGHDDPPLTLDYWRLNIRARRH